jgi:Na+-translocating ferredoxin:NAD+ oxidoreductase RNF subunit RnfB
VSTTSRVAAPLSSFGAIVMVYESMSVLRRDGAAVCDLVVAPSPGQATAFGMTTM